MGITLHLQAQTIVKFGKSIERPKKLFGAICQKNPLTFWSSHISGCQRLSSGNTLIVEGGKGCIFEVTTKGEVVWEYINPFYGPHSEIPDGEINWVFRAKRYAPNSPELGGRV